MGTRRRYTREFMVEAVRVVTERHVSMAQTSRDLGVHLNTLRKWVQELRDDSIHAFPGGGIQRPDAAELTRLRREVAKLRQDRDVLEEAAAFFAKEAM